MEHHPRRTVQEATRRHKGDMFWEVKLDDGSMKVIPSGGDLPKNLHGDQEFFVPAEFVCKDPSIFTKTKWSEFQSLMRIHDNLHPLQSVAILSKLRANLHGYDYDAIYQKWLATKDGDGDGGAWADVNGDILEMHILQRKLGTPIMALKEIPLKENTSVCLFIRPNVKY